MPMTRWGFNATGGSSGQSAPGMPLTAGAAGVDVAGAAMPGIAWLSHGASTAPAVTVRFAAIDTPVCTAGNGVAWLENSAAGETATQVKFALVGSDGARTPPVTVHDAGAGVHQHGVAVSAPPPGEAAGAARPLNVVWIATDISAGDAAPASPLGRIMLQRFLPEAGDGVPRFAAPANDNAPVTLADLGRDPMTTVCGGGEVLITWIDAHDRIQGVMLEDTPAADGGGTPATVRKDLAGDLGLINDIAVQRQMVQVLSGGNFVVLSVAAGTIATMHAQLLSTAEAYAAGSASDLIDLGAALPQGAQRLAIAAANAGAGFTVGWLGDTGAEHIVFDIAATAIGRAPALLSAPGAARSGGAEYGDDGEPQDGARSQAHEFVDPTAPPPRADAGADDSAAAPDAPARTAELPASGSFIVGTSGSDVLVASATGNDTIDAGRGDDRIVGGGGANVIFGNAGSDSIIAGTGRGFFDGDGSASPPGGQGSPPVVVVPPSVPPIAAGDDDDDNADGETGHAGGGAPDVDHAGEMPDAGEHRAEHDRGDAGRGDAGREDAGRDVDTLSYEGHERGLRIDMTETRADVDVDGDGRAEVTTGTVRQSGDADAPAADSEIKDHFRNIENIVAGQGDDVIIGDDAANRLEGRGGDDSIIGGAGDTLLGGSGDDTVAVSGDASLAAAPDQPIVMSGGSGRDVAAFANVTSGLVIDLTGAPGADGQSTNSGTGTVRLASGQPDALAADLNGVAGPPLALAADAQPSGGAAAITGAPPVGSPVVLLSGIEDVIGGSGDDRIAGDDADNLLVGGAGDDTLIGRGGNDTLVGGDGTADVAAFDRVSAAFEITSFESGYRVRYLGSDGDSTDTLMSIEFVHFIDGRFDLASLVRHDVLSDTPSAMVTARGNDVLIDVNGNIAQPSGPSVPGSANAPAIAIVEVNGTAISSDSDNNIVAVDNGYVVLRDDGQLLFVPDDDYIGHASFSYTTADATGTTETSAFSIAVTSVADAPGLSSGGNGSAGVDNSGPQSFGQDSLGFNTLGPDKLGLDTLGADAMGQHVLGSMAAIMTMVDNGSAMADVNVALQTAELIGTLSDNPVVVADAPLPDFGTASAHTVELRFLDEGVVSNTQVVQFTGAVANAAAVFTALPDAPVIDMIGPAIVDVAAPAAAATDAGPAAETVVAVAGPVALVDAAIAAATPAPDAAVAPLPDITDIGMLLEEPALVFNPGYGNEAAISGRSADADAGLTDPLVDLTGSAYTTLQEMLDAGAIAQVGDDVVITLDAADPAAGQVTLKSVNVSALNEADFKF